MRAFVSTYSDELLLSGLRDGDEDCFTEIYRRQGKRLFYLAEALLGEEELAADCVQEVFLSLWKRREEVEIVHVEAYLKKAIRFQALWMIRNKKISAKCYEIISKISAEIIVSEPGLIKEAEIIFQEAVRSLPDEAREVFHLVRNEGMSYKEVAALKGISVKTVERRMSLSIKELRLKLSDLLHFIFL